ncbi:MAG: sulfurtransferase [Gemmatimonadales bacterium]
MWPLLLALPLLAQPPEIPRVVTVDWLAAHLADPKLVLFQIGDDRSKPAYDAGHIPGSQFVHPWRELSAPPSEGGLTLELPEIGVLDSVLEAKGVSDDSKIVLVLAQEYFTPTSRTALVLEWAGLAGRVAFLDGGLEAWKAAGREVTTEVPNPKRGHFTPRVDPSVVVGAKEVRAAIDDPAGALIDARAQRFYEGGETRQGRNGHIPHAKSLPFVSLVGQDGLLKSKPELERLFRAAGAGNGKRVIAYCHIGQQATLVWFAARLVGLDASLYDGSFQDWARRTDLPVEGPEGSDR